VLRKMKAEKRLSWQSLVDKRSEVTRQTNWFSIWWRDPDKI